MKISKLIVAISVMPLVGACTTVTVREDPRSYSTGHTSIYRNTDNAPTAGSTTGGSGSPRRTVVTVSKPQATPIRVKAGTQPTQYQNTTSPYDRSGSASPLRHDTPDQPLYKR